MAKEALNELADLLIHSSAASAVIESFVQKGTTRSKVRAQYG